MALSDHRRLGAGGPRQGFDLDDYSASSQSERIIERVSSEWSQKLKTYATVGLAFTSGGGRSPRP